MTRAMDTLFGKERATESLIPKSIGAVLLRPKPSLVTRKRRGWHGGTGPKSRVLRY
jgi:hypothetical protein